MSAMTQSLPRAMLIDMDDTILSAYGRPEIAWNTVTAEFAEEFGPLPPQDVATAVLAFARNWWASADTATDLTSSGVTKSRPATAARQRASLSSASDPRGLAPTAALGLARVAATSSTM